MTIQDQTVELIRRVERTTESPPQESALCRWCEFQNICPIWKHPVQVQELAPEVSDGEAGVRLVNTPAALKRKRQVVEVSVSAELKACEEETKSVEAQLIEPAKREGLEVIQGAQCRVRVKLTGRWKLPEKGDAARQELEQVLRQEGLWEKVSSVDPSALEELLSRVLPVMRSSPVRANSRVLKRPRGSIFPKVTRKASMRLLIREGDGMWLSRPLGMNPYPSCQKPPNH